MRALILNYARVATVVEDATTALKQSTDGHSFWRCI
jgi:hypothetical protein